MKAIQLLALATSSVLTMNYSCHKDKEEPCPSKEVAGTSLQLTPCVPNQSGSAAKLFVINSVADYSAAFPCASTLPSQVDFTTHTLLVGWKNYCCCGHVKSQRLVYSCQPATYTYTVEIEPGVCAAAFPVASVLLVPKLPAGANVVIDMQ